MGTWGRTLKERIIHGVEDGPNGCWLWSGAKHQDGYGMMRVGGKKGKTLLTHRVSYTEFVGPIPKNLQIDHLCEVEACCNPTHLEAVTNAVNAARRAARKRARRP